MSDMISELLTMLDALQGEPFFYLEDGPLKNRLVESYMEEEDVRAELPDFEHNASLRIKPGANAAPDASRNITGLRSRSAALPAYG